MLHITEAQGAIFDVDDTLLDNNSSPDPTQGLHARSRLAAVHEAGRRFDIPALVALTPERNVEGFMTAPTHSLAGAAWNIMYMQGVVQTEVPDYTDPVLQAIVALKNEQHEEILRKYGKAVAGSPEFIASLARNGLRDHLAVASSAIRRDIDIFFEMIDIVRYFPGGHIISLEDIDPAHSKPDPLPFDLAFRSLGLPDTPEVRRSVIGFEDDPRGIRSMKAAGLYACAITTKFTAESNVLQAAGADEVRDSYDDYGKAMGLPEFV